ncbi:MAG: SLC13 family permease [Gemmatimonadaceae bacterium]
MTVDIALVLVVLVAAVALFASGRLATDLVALLVMVVLLLLGLVSPDEAIAGFSNHATITVGAMFVLSAGLYRSGAVNFLGAGIIRLGRTNLWLAILSLMLGIAAISAFINNTAAVAIFLPIAVSAAATLKVSPAVLLMPLSFASMFGGASTLIGTSTNLLASAVAEEHGLPPIAMFEMSKLGLIFVAAGTAYMLLVGVRLIPRRERADALDEEYGMGDYLVEVVVGENARSVGQRIGDSALVKETGVEVMDVIRNGLRIPFPSKLLPIEAGDVLRLRGNVKSVTALQERQGITIRPREKWAVRQLADGPTQQVEVILAPSSPLHGHTLRQARFADRFGAMVLAIRHRGRVMHEELERTRLLAGDALLVEVPTDRLEALRRSPDFVVVSTVERPTFRRRLIIPAVAILGGVVALAALGLLPILVGAIVGAVLMVLTGCLSLDEAYAAVDWDVIFLLAGILTLGTAMSNTGAAALLAGWLVSGLGSFGPYALVATFYLLTSVLTSTMSNNATAVLLAPIAIATAASLAVDPRPLLMAVAFAASASFATPMGYQTNLMIYGAGNFRFTDFVRVGGPLTLIFWVIATICIPIFWPF